MFKLIVLILILALLFLVKLNHAIERYQEDMQTTVVETVVSTRVHYQYPKHGTTRIKPTQQAEVPEAPLIEEKHTRIITKHHIKEWIENDRLYQEARKKLYLPRTT